MEQNEKTLQAYETGSKAYIEATSKVVSGEMREWLDRFRIVAHVDDRILEVGSGQGRDADYLESYGHTVIRTDAVQSFVDYLNKRGREAYQLNLLEEGLPEKEFGAVLANAVLLHFTTDQCVLAIDKIIQTLKPGGTFAFSMKYGRGEEWSDHKTGAPRYFNYWQTEELEQLIEARGLELVEMERTTDGKWLHIITRRPIEW